MGRLQRENFEKAFKAGVKMAFGTDAGVYPHGENAKQFSYMGNMECRRRRRFARLRSMLLI